MEELVIRAMERDDWPAVRAVFEQGIATGMATFERHAPSWEAWDAAHLPRYRVVAEAAGRVVGWAAATRVSPRPVYRGVVEDSVYVAEDVRGLGVGRALLDRLVAETERDGIWTLQAGIFPENEASLALHRRAGFRVVGVRVGIGKLDGVWRDVVLMERRSEGVR